jgi:UDP-N-acetylmuramyl pentapeptide phosphotransferase/UDP-N-acetylglucosamine-1-phosphate transferase
MMTLAITYLVLFAVLLIAELVYFRIADKYNVVDKPNERSSHTSVVLRGGGVIFTFAVIAWAIYQLLFGKHADTTGLAVVCEYLPFIVGLLMVSTVSFVDDVKGTSNKVRLIVQFASAALLCGGVMPLSGACSGGTSCVLATVALVACAVVACVGIMNVYNFMDGINGMTGGYSFSALVSLLVLNECVLPQRFVVPSLLACELLAVVIFCFFNFRPKGKAKCFAGDVGSIAVAFVLLFALARLVCATGDWCWIVFLAVYGVDGVLTICHRIMLHEKLGQAHRKHAYQIMANELKICPVAVSLLYLSLQLLIDMVMIFAVPDTFGAHLAYLLGTVAVLSVAYILFMRKYYHLHAEYLATLSAEEHHRA